MSVVCFKSGMSIRRLQIICINSTRFNLNIKYIKTDYNGFKHELFTFGGNDGVFVINGEIQLLFRALDIIVGGVFNGIRFFKNDASRVG